MWDLPGPGLEPVSPALAGGFLTTEPQGKSKYEFLWGQWNRVFEIEVSPFALSPLSGLKASPLKVAPLVYTGGNPGWWEERWVLSHSSKACQGILYQTAFHALLRHLPCGHGLSDSHFPVQQGNNTCSVYITQL